MTLYHIPMQAGINKKKQWENLLGHHLYVTRILNLEKNEFDLLFPDYDPNSVECRYPFKRFYSLVSQLCPKIATINVHEIGEHGAWLRKFYDLRAISSEGPETTYQSFKKVLANQRNAINPLPSVIKLYCDQISESHQCEKVLRFRETMTSKEDDTLFYTFCNQTGIRQCYKIRSIEENKTVAICHLIKKEKLLLKVEDMTYDFSKVGLYQKAEIQKDELHHVSLVRSPNYSIGKVSIDQRGYLSCHGYNLLCVS